MSPKASAGYSGTPLAKKLGIKPGARVLAKNAPADYKKLLAPIPEGVVFVAKSGKDLDLIHFFAKSCREFAAALPGLLESIKRDGTIWISWPKQASKIETDMTEGVVRDVALPLGLVDVKVCAVDEIWSGLKLVIRLKNR